MNKQKAISEIIENFNWEKVRKTMTALDWTWVGSEDNVPSIGKLITTATRLLEQAYDGALRKQETYLSGTGGFEAVCYVDEDDNICRLTLRFVVDKWDYEM